MDKEYLYMLYEKTRGSSEQFAYANKDKDEVMGLMEKFVQQAIRHKNKKKYHIKIYNITDSVPVERIIRSDREKLYYAFNK